MTARFMILLSRSGDHNRDETGGAPGASMVQRRPGEGNGDNSANPLQIERENPLQAAQDSEVEAKD